MYTPDLFSLFFLSTDFFFLALNDQVYLTALREKFIFADAVLRSPFYRQIFSCISFSKEVLNFKLQRFVRAFDVYIWLLNSVLHTHISFTSILANITSFLVCQYLNSSISEILFYLKIPP